MKPIDPASPSVVPPKVSIGIPLYNESRFLKPALDSILSQDFADFELVLSDNASTDSTGEICMEYAARDRRIRYERHEINIGQVRNFNRVFERSTGEYFAWGGGHDVWGRSFISRCLSVLESDPSVVLCYPLIKSIDESGADLRIDPSRMDTRTLGISSRWNCVIWGLNRCDLIYGLARRSAVAKTGLFREMLSPDNLIAAELSLSGAIAHLPEPLFSIRCQRRNETYAQAVARGQSTWGSGPKVFFFPSWRHFGGHITAVIGSTVPMSRKPVLLASALFGLLARRSKHMIHDVILCVKRMVSLRSQTKKI